METINHAQHDELFSCIDDSEAEFVQGGGMYPPIPVGLLWVGTIFVLRYGPFTPDFRPVPV